MKIEMLSSSDIHRCPIKSFDASHYFDDGTCRCGPYCQHCGLTLHPQAEKAIGSGEWQLVWADMDGAWICARTGNEHEPTPGT